ncbi:MAG TPA: Asp-tRNA(Asn)/Glu-tRNA(Gln) amidotransferase subunit GatB [Candidatus Saccharimonadales bacterium]|nr:Asp-tRNA(Asn)/Glu-tRNA(Gln) amidotransferase subunit GatB [Candidatus Saccharimonadales bacterium]
MISDEIRDRYRATIGIECHVQFNTKTKLFSAVDNDARQAAPNSLVSHIDFGLPGALPVLNEAAVHLAVRAAFALGVDPQKFSKFDRKHYFYPDLPMGYQITQYDQPIVLGGSVKIEVDGQEKIIGITRAHMEADAGKSTHPAGKDYSLVDLNRAGTPLLEIVSEPDMHSAAEAKAYARELYLLMKYADVSDANLYYGNMRFDVNVSVSQTKTLGTRTETKNLNSFRSVEKAVEHEIERQIELLEKGGKIVQETRGWDDAKQKTFSQRTKENADDYRYMPDPDLPPIVLEDSYLEQIRAEMPVMPSEWRKRLTKLGLDKSHVEILLEAEVEDQQISYLPLVEMNLSKPHEAKFLANWFVNLEIPLRREGKITRSLKDAERAEIYLAVYALIDQNKLSSTGAKAVLSELLEIDVLPKNIEEFAADKGLIQVSDEAEIAKIVKQVLADNPKAAEDLKNGEMRAIGFLVGQIMKASKGQANPALAQKLIKKQLGV